MGKFRSFSLLWTAPAILFASIVITWGAEAAQFFVAQGFALAILAFMQTLPEFAVEAVLAWKQQSTLLLANLTGAVRLLTGLAWPMIYLTAAMVYRRRTKRSLDKITLHGDQSVEVIGLVLPLLYAIAIWWKASLNVYDAAILTSFYAAYLVVLTKLPPKEKEGVEELESIPRRIVQAPRGWRITAIAACFLTGGTLIYFTAEPFLDSMLAAAAAIGIPSFIAIQWFAPVISEFPELASTFYFARQADNASVALMNITSSNINQWTLLFAMLPVVYSLSRGTPSTIAFDQRQQQELLLTIGQSLVGLMFLLNMEFAWWEALMMFVLFVAQFVEALRGFVTVVFFVWTAVEVGRIIWRRRLPKALTSFAETWPRRSRD